MAKRQKFRGWCFTNFNLEFDYEGSKLERGGWQYLAYGEEVCPKTGKRHHQGWIYFSNPVGSLKNVQRQCGGNSHVEGIRGSLQQNENYCAKDGKLTELGTKPEMGARTDLRTAADSIANGESVDSLILEDPYLCHTYGRTLDRLERLHMRSQKRKWPCVGIWLWGKTFTGKSHRALTCAPEDKIYDFDAADNLFACGYRGEPVVVINDFRGEIPFGMLLKMVDRWPYNLKVKCGERVPFLAKFVIVTSPNPPEIVYSGIAEKDSDSLNQLLSRFGPERSGQTIEVTSLKQRIPILENLLALDDFVSQSGEAPESAESPCTFV